MKKDKRRRNKVKEEKRPSLETNGMGFDEVLKRLASTNPEEIKKLEDDSKKESTSSNPTP
jgi:hypothetical protein